MPIGEWVWVIDKCIYGNGIYCTIDCQDDDEPICILSSRINTQVYKFDDYGKTWTAYKNKEQAEGEYDSLAVELEGTIEEINEALKTNGITIDGDGNVTDSRVEQAKKQTAKEILQELYNLPVCTHSTIGTGQYTFGRRFVKDWAKSKYGVEVDE